MPDQPEVDFVTFILSLAHNAAVFFGDVPDPASGQKGAPNVEGARHMIEILGMLEQKTRGNLSAQERQVLDDLLYGLRLRFVQASAGVPGDAS